MEQTEVAEKSLASIQSSLKFLMFLERTDVLEGTKKSTMGGGVDRPCSMFALVSNGDLDQKGKS